MRTPSKIVLYAFAALWVFSFAKAAVAQPYHYQPERYRYQPGGPDIGAIIGTVIQNALRPRYRTPQDVYAEPLPPPPAPPPPVQQRRAPTQDQWRQSLLDGAAAFCRQYPADGFCGPPAAPEALDMPPVQPAPLPAPPASPARPYMQR